MKRGRKRKEQNTADSLAELVVRKGLAPTGAPYRVEILGRVVYVWGTSYSHAILGAVYHVEPKIERVDFNGIVEACRQASLVNQEEKKSEIPEISG